ncbi:MAG TPA: terminase small subunit [Burkholderiales bacterium]|nr:terminase small subunit [Burkholderiales bacterium]
MDTALTDRQLRFVFEYLQDQNASAAAVRAGYSEKSRAAQAHELMNNPAVQERIRMEMQSLLAEVGCSALELMMERKRAAFFRAGKMFKAGWELAAPDEMEEETAAALEVRTVLRKGGPEVHLRQPDRNKALRALERVHERLEMQSERHYARLEKAGRVKSLEEIEAMDGGGASAAPAADFSEKPMVLSGSTTSVVEPASHFREKPMVPQGDFLRGVFSGSGLPRPQASPWLLQAAQPPAPSWAQLRAA